METERTLSLWPEKVLIIPPVCRSQSLMVLSLLPDASNASFDEKATDLTMLLCPERIHVWLQVMAFMIRMFPDCRPTATVLLQYEAVDGLASNAIVREHAPHSAASSLDI